MLLTKLLRLTDGTARQSSLAGGRHRLLSAPLLIVALSVAATATSAQTRFDEEFDEQNKPWEEIAVQLPSPPLDENLAPFYVSATATQTFAIDTKSLTVGTDAVVRYTMVSTSAGGAKNISYEGIRCHSFEKKSYAFGRADGTWSRSRHDQWERILLNLANRQHGALAKDYLCDGRVIAGKAKDIVMRLRKNQPFSPEG